MAPYEVVIWNAVTVYHPTGYVYIMGISLTQRDFEAVSTYLDGGGNLLLTSSNITEYYGADPADPSRNLLYEFLQSYLHIQQPGDTAILIQNHSENMAGANGDLFERSERHEIPRRVEHRLAACRFLMRLSGSLWLRWHSLPTSKRRP